MQKKLIGYGVYCADFRWHNGEITILEIGDGLSSNFSGYEKAYGASLYSVIYRHINQDLAGLGFSRKFTETKPQTTEELRAICGRMIADDDYLLTNKEPVLFEGAPQFEGWEENTTIALEVVYRSSPRYVKFHYTQQERMAHRLNIPQGNSSIVLQANDSFTACTEDKFWLSLFQRSVQTAALPAEFLIDLDNLDLNLLEVDEEKHYVIKPTNASGGDGVLVVKSHLLKTLLSALSSSEKYLLPTELLDEKKFEAGFDFHCKRKQRIVVVQNFVEADLIECNGQKFNPTGRLIFTVKKFDDASVCVEVIPQSMYFKFPQRPYQGVSTTDCVSDMCFYKSMEQKSSTSSAPIDQTLQKQISASFLKKAKPLFSEIMSTTMETMIIKILDSELSSGIKSYCLRSFEKTPVFPLSTNTLTQGAALKRHQVTLDDWIQFLIQQLKMSVLSRYNAPINKDLLEVCKRMLSRRVLSEDQAKDLLSYCESSIGSLEKERIDAVEAIKDLAKKRLEPIPKQEMFIEQTHHNANRDDAQTSSSLAHKNPQYK